MQIQKNNKYLPGTLSCIYSHTMMCSLGNKAFKCQNNLSRESKKTRTLAILNNFEVQFTQLIKSAKGSVINPHVLLIIQERMLHWQRIECILSSFQLLLINTISEIDTNNPFACLGILPLASIHTGANAREHDRAIYTHQSFNTFISPLHTQSKMTWA